MGIPNSNHAKHLVSQGVRYTLNVASFEGGTMPELGQNGVLTRTTVETSNIAEGTQNKVGVITPAGGTDPRPTGTLTVANNDFTTGPCVLRIGDYEFLPGVDFLVGAAVANTATNLAAALETIQGWSATPAGASVQFWYPHPGRIRFEVKHFGTIENLTPLTPSSGYCQYGGQQPGPPILT